MSTNFPFRFGLVWCASLFAHSPARGAAAVVLNEVFYDPEGADTGLEFVEIAAVPGADPAASLQGWVLETGNGSRPDEWTVAWTGRAGDQLRNGIFLLGEDLVEPRPDAVVDLDLQNGPDACRLRGPAGQVDLVGWGSPLDVSFVEREAALDVASGVALARLPDGVDRDCNSCDFHPLSPTPGDFNAPAIGVVVEAQILPPTNFTGSAFEFSWTLRNIGREPWVGPARLLCSAHPGEILASFDFDDLPLPPGETREHRTAVAPSRGIHQPVSDPPFGESAPVWIVESAELAITEVFSHPGDGESEWFECKNLGGLALRLDSLVVADAASSKTDLSGVLEPGAFLLVCEDSNAVRAHSPTPASALLLEVSPWPSLNHSSSGGVAEVLRILWGSNVLEEAQLPSGLPESKSWERVSLQLPGSRLEAWQISLDPSGSTPGKAPRGDGDRPLPLNLSAAAILVEPRVFTPEIDGPALIVVRAPGERFPRFVDCHDSEGRLVRQVPTWPAGNGEHRALWDGRDLHGNRLPLGLYIVGASDVGVPPRATVVLR